MNDPYDEENHRGRAHGTKVAGVIGAITNNGEGVAGMMWYCTIIPVKVMGLDDVIEDANAALGINYAVQQGAKIINCSFGHTEISPFNLYVDCPSSEVIWNAYKLGVIITAAMGNTDDYSINFPAALPCVIAVGATDNLDQRATYSTWGSCMGSHIDVSAPGGSWKNYSTFPYDDYYYFSGTSCATPFVSGTGGLILSQGLDRELNITNDDVKHIIEQTATDVNGTIYPGWDEYLGYGRINAGKALEMLCSPNTFNSYSINTSNSMLILDSHTRTFKNNAGLSTDVYFGVKQFKISGHITFPVPYLSIPSVWPKENSCIGWSSANPNKEINWAGISNISTTGFDYETFVYYIGYNSKGQFINKYWPGNKSYIEATIAYTVVGEKTTINIPDDFSSLNDAMESPVSGQTINVDGSLQLDDNIIVPSGVNLVFKIGANINMSGHQITLNGGTITIEGNEGDVTILPNIRLKNGTSTIGLYPSISSAFSDGDVVEVRDEYTSSVNVEVDNGETLKPQSGSELKFASGKYLGIKSGGNLTSNGATFTSTSGAWNGVKYYSGSAGSLTNCTISDALYGVRLNSSRTVDNCTITSAGSTNYGVYVNSANPNVKNNTITGSSFSSTTNTSYGIYCYSSSPDITNNTITADYGIYCNNSSPDIKENNVTNEIAGLYCESSSSPLLVWQEANVDGDNYFHSDYTEFGAWITGNSNPIIGTVSCGQELFGRNSFDYDDIDLSLVYNTTNNTIKAEHCWWGSSPPSAGLFSGSVDYDPWLTGLPSYSSPSPSPENNLYDTRMMLSSVMPEEEASEDLTRYYNEQWDLDKKIDFIRYLYIIGEAKGVADLCKDIICENPYAPEAFTALDMIYQISKNEKIKKDFDKGMIKTYLKTFEDSRSNQFLKADAMLLLAGLEKDVKLMDKVYKEHKDTYMGKYALHQKFMYYFHEADMELSRSVLDLMDDVYPNEAETYESHVLMGDEVMNPKEFYSQYHKKNATEQAQLTSTDIAEILPEEYALSIAYPNPFNPSTTLEYALPVQSKVECSIFDLSGNLVKEFSYDQNAGTHSITWDGSNVSSGIYLIRFTAEAEDGSNSFVDYQKVTLLK